MFYWFIKSILFGKKNLYNGIGGKIKFGECYYKAVVRELEEETGIKLKDNIYEILTLHYESCRVLVYTGMTDDIYNAKQTTEEELLIIPPKDIDIFNCVWDLKYLMPLCLERLKEYGSWISIYITIRLYYFCS